MTLTIDIERLLETVYALNALGQFAKDAPKAQSPLLSRDEQGALAIAAEAAVSNLCLSLHPYITGLERGDGSLMQLEVAGSQPDAAASALLLAAVEQLAAMETLRLVDRVPSEAMWLKVLQSTRCRLAALQSRPSRRLNPSWL